MSPQHTTPKARSSPWRYRPDILRQHNFRTLFLTLPNAAQGRGTWRLEEARLVLPETGRVLPAGGVSVLVRVWLPDRPGALGAVASRIGAVRGDILGIDVLERSDGLVIDEIGVTLPSPGVLPLLIREVEEVDGARVEEARVVEQFSDPRLDALAAAVLLSEAADPSDLCATLVTCVGRALLADWVAVMEGERVLDVWGEPPADDHLVTLAAAVRHPEGAGPVTTRREHLAAAVLSVPDLVLLVGRTGHTLRAREQLQLAALARVADRLWVILARLEGQRREPARPPGRRRAPLSAAG